MIVIQWTDKKDITDKKKHEQPDNGHNGLNKQAI